MATLNTNATSVVDFLKNRGFQTQAGDKFPLYGQRQQLYDALGYGSQYGDYAGSAEQNTALLRALSSAEAGAGVSINPENIMSVLRVGGSPASGVVRQAQQATPRTGADGMVVSPRATGLGALAEAAYKQLSPGETARQAMDYVTSRATFPLQREASEAEKMDIQTKARAEKEKLISQLASKGLLFSSKKQQGIEGIDAEAIGKKLGVDRKFALLIASGLESAAQRIASEAQKGNKDAQDALKALGYVAMPDGQGGYAILPSFEAQKYAQTEERMWVTQEAQQARFEAAQAATQARFEQSQAATQARFEATYARLVSGQPTEDDLNITADLVDRGELSLDAVPAAQRNKTQKKLVEIQIQGADEDVSAAVFAEGAEILDSPDFFAELRGAYKYISDQQIKEIIERARKEREVGYTTISGVKNFGSTPATETQSFFNRLFYNEYGDARFRF